MSLFSRNRAVTTPEQVPVTASGPTPEAVRPPTRKELWNQARDLLRRAEAQQNEFATWAVAKGFTDVQISAAAAEAMHRGILPRLFREPSMRNGSPIPCTVLYGPVPSEALSVTREGQEATLSLGYTSIAWSRGQAVERPTRDTVADPNRDFYLETHYIPLDDTQTTGAAMAQAVAVMQQAMPVQNPE